MNERLWRDRTQDYTLADRDGIMGATRPGYFLTWRCHEFRTDDAGLDARARAGASVAPGCGAQSRSRPPIPGGPARRRHAAARQAVRPADARAVESVRNLAD